MPDDDEDIDEDTVGLLSLWSEKSVYSFQILCSNHFYHLSCQAEELQNQMEQDYDIG